MQVDVLEQGGALPGGEARMYLFYEATKGSPAASGRGARPAWGRAGGSKAGGGEVGGEAVMGSRMARGSSGGGGALGAGGNGTRQRPQHDRPPGKLSARSRGGSAIATAATRTSRAPPAPPAHEEWRSPMLQREPSISWRGQLEEVVAPQPGPDSLAPEQGASRQGYVHSAFRRRPQSAR